MTFYKKSYGMVAPKATSYWCGVVPVELMRKALSHLDDQVSQHTYIHTYIFDEAGLRLATQRAGVDLP